MQLVVVFLLALAVPGVAFADAARHAIAANVTVTITDARLIVSRSGLQAGQATFAVVNDGHGAHALTITGPGLTGARTPKLHAGASATLTVTLRAGAYTLTDPFARKANVHWLVVSPATNVTSTGTSSVVTPIISTTGTNCD